MRVVGPNRATRAELTRRLAVIQSNIPMLLSLFPGRAEFFNEFASFTEDVKQCARPEDQAWATERIQQMLREHGMASEP
ncbi:MAG: hypothetical protein ABI767_04305 [Rhodanobacter sp.]